MPLSTSLKSSAQLNASSIKSKHTSFSIYKRISPSPPMFYFSKCTQPCSQSALHFLLFSFLWFTDKNTWGKKKAQYQIPGGCDLPQEKKCVTGAHCPGWEQKAQQTGPKALCSEAVVPSASQVCSQARPWRVTLSCSSCSSVIDPCRGSEESEGVLLSGAILQPKRKSNKQLLPGQDLSSPWRKPEKRISTAISSHENPRMLDLLQLWLA